MATRVKPEAEDFTGLRDTPAKSTAKKTTAKKTTATKTTAAKTPAKKVAAAPAKRVSAAESNGEVKHRRSMGGRGWLAVEIDKILRKAPAGTPVTVSSVAAKITNVEGEHPSSGAVAACFNRWAEAGYIKLNRERPAAFTGFAGKWREKKLAEFLESQSASRKSERAAAKAKA